MQKTVFISDCHLCPTEPLISDIFIRFLNNLTNTDALYILGDLFEIWIGDDDTSLWHDSIIQTIRDVVSRGIPVFIGHGNRDFLLGRHFFRATGARLLPEEYVIDLYGTSTLLMHGDTLCTHDIGYLRYRRKVRNRFIQWLFLLKSLKSRRAMAMKLRERSQRHQSSLSDAILDVTEGEVQRIMQAYGVSQLIHGHTHRPAIHPFTLNDQIAKRIVLAAWHTQGNALIAYSDGALVLRYFS